MPPYQAISTSGTVVPPESTKSATVTSLAAFLAQRKALAERLQHIRRTTGDRYRFSNMSAWRISWTSTPFSPRLHLTCGARHNHPSHARHSSPHGHPFHDRRAASAELMAEQPKAKGTRGQLRGKKVGTSKGKGAAVKGLLLAVLKPNRQKKRPSRRFLAVLKPNRQKQAPRPSKNKASTKTSPSAPARRRSNLINQTVAPRLAVCRSHSFTKHNPPLQRDILHETDNHFHGRNVARYWFIRRPADD